MGLDPWSKGSRICGLCGEFRKMTRAHVPPQAAGNTGSVTSATVRVYSNQRTAGRPRTGGMWLRGLCRDCNSLAGENYDAAYGDFTARISAYFSARTRLRLPAAESAPPVSVAPGRVARSVLIGMFATTPHLRTMFPSLACDLQHRRPHIAMPDGATLRMALYPSRSTRLASMAYGLRILTRRQHYHVFSEIYFRPLAWVLSPNEDRLDVAELGESAVSSWPVVDQWLQGRGQVQPEGRRDPGVVVDRRPRPTKITSGAVGLIHDREVEAVHALTVEPLPARQSGLQRPANLPLTLGSVGVLAVHKRGIRGEHDHRPGPGPQRQLDRVGRGSHAQLLQYRVVLQRAHRHHRGPVTDQPPRCHDQQ